MRRYVVLMALCFAAASIEAHGQSDESLTTIKSYIGEYGFDSFMQLQVSEVRKRHPPESRALLLKDRAAGCKEHGFEAVRGTHVLSRAS